MSLKKLKLNIDLILTLLVGLVVRLRIINAEEFWFDEAFTGILMRVSKAEFWDVVSRDVNPPLYYLMLKAWSTLFGTNDMMLRMFSLVVGLLTISVMYFLVRELLNKESAVIAAFLVSISPFFTWFSVEARSYNLYGLLVLSSVYFLIKKNYPLFTITIIASMATHYLTVIYLLPIGLLAAWQIYTEKSKIKDIIMYFTPVAIGALVTINYATGTKESLNTGWIKQANFSNLAASSAAYLLGIKTKLTGSNDVNNINFMINEKMLGWIFFVLFITGIIFMILKLKDKPRTIAKFLIITSFVLLPQLLIIIVANTTEYNIYLERYLFPSSLFFIIAISFMLNNLLSFEVTAMTLLFYVFLISKVVTHNYYTGMQGISSLYRGTDKEMVFTSPVDYVVGRYYLGENLINTKIYNPDEPENTYFWWPFVRENVKPGTLRNSVIIAPATKTMSTDFIQINGVEDYSIYVKKNP